MNEKILAEGKINTRKIKSIAIIMFCVLVVFAIVSMGSSFIDVCVDNYYDGKYGPDVGWDKYQEWTHTPIGSVLSFWPSGNVFEVSLIILALLGALFLLSVVFYFYASKMHIVVSDKRVFGESVFGKRVDLPLDSVSAIGKAMFKGLAVATSAGKIKFFGFPNRNEIYDTLNNLLLERQKNKAIEKTTISSADELKKYKICWMAVLFRKKNLTKRRSSY